MAGGGARRERVGGLEAVVLSHGGLEAWIVPSHGSNLARFTVGDRAVIDFDPGLLSKHDYTGTPVLYPTPNRVRDGVFRWKGRDYRQLKRGSSSWSTAWPTASPGSAASPCARTAGCAWRPGWISSPEPRCSKPSPSRTGCPWSST